MLVDAMASMYKSCIRAAPSTTTNSMYISISKVDQDNVGKNTAQ